MKRPKLFSLCMIACILGDFLRKVMLGSWAFNTGMEMIVYCAIVTWVIE